jgi:hypothetical protein
MDTHRTKTNPQSQYCGTAPYSLHSRQRRQCTPTTRIVHRAYDASHFAGPMRTLRTFRPAPRSPRSSLRTHQKHARASTPTARLAPPTITARQRHGACHPKQHKHTSPARPHDVPHSRHNTALRNRHRMHTAARTPRTARHTAPTTPHATHRKSHPVTHAASAPHSRQSCQIAQRRRDAAGECVVAQVQPPAGHTNSHRVTPWHPTPPQTPAAHRIASIELESSQKKASQYTARCRSCTTPRVSDPKTTQPDSPQVADAVIMFDKPAATLAHVTTQPTAMLATRKQALGTTKTQQLQTASECRESHTCRTATRRR